MEKLETLKKASEELLKIAAEVQKTGKMETISELERRGVENLRVIEAAMAFAGRGLYELIQNQRRLVNTGQFVEKKAEPKKEAKPAKKPAAKKSK